MARRVERIDTVAQGSAESAVLPSPFLNDSRMLTLHRVLRDQIYGQEVTELDESPLNL
jgi:hypothetical protein